MYTEINKTSSLSSNNLYFELGIELSKQNWQQNDPEKHEFYFSKLVHFDITSNDIKSFYISKTSIICFHVDTLNGILSVLQ